MLLPSILMPPPSRPTWLRYGTAIIVTIAALGLKLLLVPLVTRDVPGLLFFAAVMVSGLYGGLGPGILAIALGAIFDSYFFMSPFGRFQLNSPDQLLRLCLFVIEGIFISLICAHMIAAKRRAEDSENESRELQRRILEIGDAEQRRIGHDLHDGLGQHLTGITMMLRRHQQDLEAAQAPAAATAGKVADLAQSALEWTRDLSQSLSPPALESAGLAEALRELAARAENLFNIECTFEQIGKPDAADLAAGVHLYRIAQEAISNAVRHGEAKQIILRFEGSRDTISLQVIDNGTGIEPTAQSADGMGLRIMRYRARMIGASIDVRHEPHGGTIVACHYHRAG